MAAGMGEPSCETIVDGVRITVHVPFEGPLNRTLAHRWIQRGRKFVAMHIFYVQDGIEPLPPGWNQVLDRLNKEGRRTAKRAHTSPARPRPELVSIGRPDFPKPQLI